MTDIAETAQRETVLSRLRFVSFCLSVSDMDTMVQWYVEKLGFSHVMTHDFENYGVKAAFLRYGDNAVIEFVESGGSVGIERPLPPNHNAARGVSQISLHVDDVTKTHEIAVAHGLKIVMDLAPYPEIQTNAFFVADPEGNIIEFFEAEWE